MKIKVPCSWCGEIVERYKSNIKNNKNVYCNSECRRKHISKKYNPEGYLKRPDLTEYNLKNNKDRM